MVAPGLQDCLEDTKEEQICLVWLRNTWMGYEIKIPVFFSQFLTDFVTNSKETFNSTDAHTHTHTHTEIYIKFKCNLIHNCNM
jgi:hypothetical protein